MKNEDLELMKKMLAQGIREVKILEYFTKANYSESEVLTAINQIHREIEIGKIRKGLK